MEVTHAKEDILPHISAQENTQAEIFAFTPASSGSYTFFSLVKIEWHLENSQLSVSANLTTPLGDVKLGSVSLTREHATAKLGGGKFGFKAEVELTADFNASNLLIKATACAPKSGCKSGSTTVHF